MYLSIILKVLLLHKRGPKVVVLTTQFGLVIEQNYAAKPQLDESSGALEKRSRALVVQLNQPMLTEVATATDPNYCCK